MARRKAAEGEAPTADSAAGSLRVGDLVAVDLVRTVVRLNDLVAPERWRELALHFVLTAEVEHCLQTVLGDVAAGRGRGYFLEGAFGSGKSHLLAVLQGLLDRRVEPASLGSGLQGGGGGSIPSLVDSALAAGPVLAVAVPLVAFGARESLEQAVLRQLAQLGGDELAPLAATPPPPRQEAFARLDAYRRRQGYAGVFIGLDELSEFLRSKPNGRSFAEDVRFLQFLGEWAPEAPAWVLGTAQEAIERTGELPAAVFGRIQDRYPVRFHLGGAHIKELIARRLIRHLPGAEQALERIYGQLARSLGNLPFSAEDFARLYPVHPLTVDLLDQLRTLFAEQRGAIDFIVSRLRGDPARRIPAFVDQPADRLLGPDQIADHFRDRIREHPETAALATVALPYFEEESARLFPDAEQARVAAAIGRVLIAGALCPTPRDFSARELADALLCRFTDLDPALNLEFVTSILEQMAQRGAYVGRRAAATPGGAPRYFCDLQENLSLVLQRRLDFWQGSLLPEDGRTWTVLLPWCEDPAVPLARLGGVESRSSWEVSWRRTPRQVQAWVAQVSLLDPAELREQCRALETSELDGILLVAAAFPGERASAIAHWEQHLAPALAGLHPALPVLLWTPRDPVPTEVEQLRQMTAYALAEAEAAEGRTATDRRLLAHLQEGAASRRRTVASLYRELYLQGELRDVSRGVRGLPVVPVGGRQPFTSLLEAIWEDPLAARFPLHPELPGRVELLLTQTAERVVANLVQGEDEGAATDAASRAVRDEFLVPMGLCRRHARGYRVALDGRNSPLAAEVLSAVESGSPASPVPVGQIYWRLRKGSAGLHRRLFELLCFTLLKSGAVGAMRGGRRASPAQLRWSSIWELDGLTPGALLEPALQETLASLPMLPPRLRRGPMTYALQQEVWDHILSWRQQWLGDLPRVRDGLQGVQRLPTLSPLLTPGLLSTLDRVEQLVAAVQPAQPAQEGLQGFLEAVAAVPEVAQTLQRAEALQNFFDHRLASYLQMVSYLTDPAFVPPGSLEKAAAELRQQAQDPEVVLGEGFDALLERFGRLREAYADAYLRGHAAAVGPAAFAAHEAVASSPAFRLAAVLGEIPGLQATPDLVTLRRAVQQALQGRCPQEEPVVRDRLHRFATCVCGYRLGQAREVPPAEALDALARQVAAAYLQVLQAPGPAGRIGGYAASLRALGREAAAAALQGLLQLSPVAPEAAEEALRLVERVGAAELRAALAGQAVVLDRDAQGLWQVLGGRVLRPQQVLQAVQQWLGEVPEGSYVRVQLAAAEAAGAQPEAGEGQPWRDPGAPYWLSLAKGIAAGRADAAALAALRGRRASAQRRTEAAARCAEGVLAVQQSLEALRRAAASPPTTWEGWEALWLGPAGQRARHLAELRAALRLAGGSGELPLGRWEAEAAEAVAALQRAFVRHLAQHPAERRGGPAEAVQQARRQLREAPGRSLYLWCLDGMRADLLQPVLTLLAAGGVSLRVVAQGAGCAAAPTTTAAQFAVLEAIQFRGELIRWDEGTEEALVSDARQLLAEVDWARGAGDGCICKWDFIDDKVHRCRDEYGTFCAEIAVQVERRLLPAALALEPGERVILCADHGFREAAPGADPEAPRYLHGGDSLDEVVAPWCLLEVQAGAAGGGA